MKRIKDKKQDPVKGNNVKNTYMIAEIRRLEQEILNSVPYDNWSAGGGIQDNFTNLNTSKK